MHVSTTEEKERHNERNNYEIIQHWLIGGQQLYLGKGGRSPEWKHYEEREKGNQNEKKLWWGTEEWCMSPARERSKDNLLAAQTALRGCGLPRSYTSLTFQSIFVTAISFSSIAQWWQLQHTAKTTSTPKYLITWVLGVFFLRNAVLRDFPPSRWWQHIPFQMEHCLPVA